MPHTSSTHMMRSRSLSPLSSRRNFQSVLSNVLWSLILLAMTVNADWIDPDTPWEARSTNRFNPYPKRPRINKDANATTSNADKKATTISPRRRHYFFYYDTFAPSASPTSSTDAPSQEPSSMPSAFPTYIPRDFTLVFSDEFNTPSRSFDDGADPRWTAIDKNDYTNDALHYYSPGNARTDDQGHLIIKTQAKDTNIVGFNDVKLKKTHEVKHFRSAMLQTWNKFCFTGGILEAEVIMPGKHDVGGLWPAFWLLGNLARHTYVGTSEHIWPWSSTYCTPKSFTAQKVSGCHQVSHYGMLTGLGRGSPEIDVFEVQPGNIKANTGAFLKTAVGQPFMSASFQVAPGRPYNRPGPGEWPGPAQWYKGLTAGKNTSLNILFYGNYNHFLSDTRPSEQDYWSDAISMNRQLDKDFFDRPHVYRLEWEPPQKGGEFSHGGYLHWFLDGELVFALNGTAMSESGFGAEISSEPSYIILNTAISKQWGFPHECPGNCPCKIYDCNSPDYDKTCGFSEGFCDMMKASDPEFKINWVRVYQDPNNPIHKVGCSTPERPTRRYIEAHEPLYKTESDLKPLKTVQNGGGTCDPSLVAAGTDVIRRETCGGSERGMCVKEKQCECLPGWTGPHCLAHHGTDPILYDEPDHISDVGFIPPSIIPRFLIGVVAFLVVFLLLSMRWRRQLEGWTPIPDADIKLEKGPAKPNLWALEQEARVFA